MASATTVTVPDIGDYHDVPVIEVLVKDGERVEKDQTLMVLESDKATLDVPAPVAGVVGGFKLKVGDKIRMMRTGGQYPVDRLCLSRWCRGHRHRIRGPEPDQ